MASGDELMVRLMEKNHRALLTIREQLQKSQNSFRISRQGLEEIASLLAAFDAAMESVIETSESEFHAGVNPTDAKLT